MNALRVLRSAQAVRERSQQLLAAGLRDELTHFSVHEERLPEVAKRTAQITRQRYPELRVPAHSRFAHFDAEGVPRTAALERALQGLESRERARRLCEVVVTSVLLDAGAGSGWRYREPDTGLVLARSEGLAVASLAWVAAGGLSGQGQRYHVDARGLERIDIPQLTAAFQVRADNPLVGVAGRVELLRALGRVLEARRDVFGPDARLGGLIDRACERAQAGVVAAPAVLELVLDALSEIWPGRLTLDGVPLGDVWRHAAVGGEGATRGLLPLHKLSQWLCYSLLQPLGAAGLAVRELDGLTGLAEYRNGGLFIDAGVLALKRPELLAQEHPVGSELIVEWRGLTVALLDRVAPLVRAELGLTADQLPLAAVLEGGTWAAGRALASELRADGSPPLRVASDGTVF